MRKVVIMPKTRDILIQMGKQIKLCRLRRDISVELLCERASISRATYWKIERGCPSVSMGHYAAALHAINGKDEDLLEICKDDKLGHLLQDGKLLKRKRASNK